MTAACVRRAAPISAIPIPTSPRESSNSQAMTTSTTSRMESSAAIFSGLAIPFSRGSAASPTAPSTEAMTSACMTWVAPIHFSPRTCSTRPGIRTTNTALIGISSMSRLPSMLRNTRASFGLSDCRRE